MSLGSGRDEIGRLGVCVCTRGVEGEGRGRGRGKKTRVGGRARGLEGEREGRRNTCCGKARKDRTGT